MKTFTEFLTESNAADLSDHVLSKHEYSATLGRFGYTNMDMVALANVKTTQSKDTLFFFPLDSTDASYFKPKLKAGQKLYRYITYTTNKAKLMPVIAVDASRNMVYYLASDTSVDDQNLEFDVKGTKVNSVVQLVKKS